MTEIISIELDQRPGRLADVVFNCDDQTELDWLMGVLSSEQAILLHSAERGYVHLRPVRHSADPGESFPRRVRVLFVESEVASRP